MAIASHGWKSVFTGNRPRSCQALSQFVLHLGRSFPSRLRDFRKIFALTTSALCSPLQDLKTAEVGSVTAEYWREERRHDGMDAARRMCAADCERGAAERLSAPI